jgi:hypothetical protein
MSEWINNTKVVAPESEHPCGRLGYCPYGPLVEEYPCHTKAVKYAVKKGWYAKLVKGKGWIACEKDAKGAMPALNRAVPEVDEPLACKTFGHDCPVHYQREEIVE